MDSSSDRRRQASLLRSVREYYRIIAIVLALSTGILLTGYSNVVLNSASGMPAFQKDFGAVHNDHVLIPSLWLGLWSGAGPIGSLVGAILAGRLQDLVGRRLSLITGTLVFVISIAACFVANLAPEIEVRRGVFLAANVVQGVGNAMVWCTVQTYVSEVAPVALRGALLTFIPVFTLLGQLLGAVVAFALLEVEGSRSYRVAFATQWPITAVVLIVALCIPETPSFLIRKKRLDEARKAQYRLRSTSATDDISRLLKTIQNETDGNGGERVGYKHCFKGKNRRRTLIVIFANFLPSLFGLQLLANSSYFLQIVGLEAGDAFRVLMIGIAVGTVANILSMWTLSVHGRRTLIMASLLVSAVLWTSVGLAGCFEGLTAAWYIGGVMIVIVLVCGVGVWPCGVVVASETSSLQLRALTQGIGVFANSISSGVFSIVLPYVFNPDSGSLGGKTGFIFATLCVGAAGTAWGWVPEMKGREAGEIDLMFAAGVPARGFRAWKGLRGAPDG